jgi:dTDP-4-amino-4,6-dideoxygalactose transaminase
MADMDPIMDIARAHKLFVIEDACQAHGAEYKENKAGTIGHAGCFSFYPGKNLGAYGEAGAVVTNDNALADKIRRIRDHGQEKKYIHSEVGWNARMDGIQGAVLSVKLKHLDLWNKLRQERATQYGEALVGIPQIVTPKTFQNRNHVYHLYPVRIPRRDDLIEVLKSKDIHCGIHYPIPIHLQKAYEHSAIHKGYYPVTEKVTSEIVSLPMFPELTADMVKFVCKEIKNWCSEE